MRAHAPSPGDHCQERHQKDHLTIIHDGVVEQWQARHFPIREAELWLVSISVSINDVKKICMQKRVSKDQIPDNAPRL